MAEVTRSTSPDLAKYGLTKGLALTRLSGGDAFKMFQRNGPSAGLAWRRDRSLFLGRLIETQRQDAGKNRHQPCDTVAPHGSHASLFVSVGVLVDCVSVWPHQQCSYAGTCSFSFPVNAVLLTLRTPGLATFVNNQFLPEPQRQCCGILFGPPQSLAAAYTGPATV
jgi:hypothetical protein